MNNLYDIGEASEGVHESHYYQEHNTPEKLCPIVHWVNLPIQISLSIDGINELNSNLGHEKS